MACDSPLKAWKTRPDLSSGRVGILFSPGPTADAPLNIPCGRCNGCRLDNARHIALRASNEAVCHIQNSFLTLTYNDENLPPGGTLAPIHLVKFWKRLRISLSRSGYHNGKVRYLACGEYGEKTLRPHYHAIVFGFWPSDCTFYSTAGGASIYSSSFLDSVWGLGSVKVGSVVPATISYVARYTSKKAGAKQEVLNPLTGELVAEFRRASRRPGLGREWYNRYRSDVATDAVYVDKGITSTIPRYYLNLLEVDDKKAFDRIKTTRNERMAQALVDDPHGSALPAKIAIRDARLKLSRGTL
ncbi:MAG: replication initiator protein [Microvirus sp.]|nr:MAG: replication initiator protein [Microvirus sp.]